jgi:hypothetical protein
MSASGILETFVLHDTRVRDSRYMLMMGNGKTPRPTIVGFPTTKSTAEFSRLVLRNYRVKDGVHNVAQDPKVGDGYHENCSKVWMELPLEMCPNTVFDHHAPTKFENDNLDVFESLVRHSIDFLLISKFELVWRRDQSTVAFPWLLVCGYRIAIGSDTKTHQVDPNDVLDCNKRALNNRNMF